MISQSREQINAVGCPIDFWECNLNNLNTYKIIRKNRKKERGKIFPTEPRKPKEKIRNTCQYHETCQDPPKVEKINVTAQPTIPRLKPDKTFTLSQYHADCGTEFKPSSVEKKIPSPTVPRASKEKDPEIHFLRCLLSLKSSENLKTVDELMSRKMPKNWVS